MKISSVVLFLKSTSGAGHFLCMIHNIHIRNLCEPLCNPLSSGVQVGERNISVSEMIARAKVRDLFPESPPSAP